MSDENCVTMCRWTEVNRGLVEKGGASRLNRFLIDVLFVLLGEAPLAGTASIPQFLKRKRSIPCRR